jgi:hypothetical protein
MGRTQWPVACGGAEIPASGGMNERLMCCRCRPAQLATEIGDCWCCPHDYRRGRKDLDRNEGVKESGIKMMTGESRVSVSIGGI